MNNPDESAAIRATMDEWAVAFCAKDVERLLACYAPDPICFDAMPPFTDSMDTLREKYRTCFPCIPDGVHCETRDLRIVMSGNLAAASFLWRLRGDMPDHPSARTWLRGSTTWQRRDGHWLILHEHWSLPFDPMSGQVAYAIEAP